MGNGFPIGGLLIKNEKMPAQKGRLGTTYGGNQLACVAGIAVLDIIAAENLIENAKLLGVQLAEELKQINGVKKVKGRGLMIGIELDFPVAELRKRLIFQHHVFTGSSSNRNLLRILPPLNMSQDNIAKFLTALKKGVSQAYTS